MQKKRQPLFVRGEHTRAARAHRVEQLLLFRVKTCLGGIFGACGAPPRLERGGSNAGRGDTETRGGGSLLRRKT